MKGILQPYPQASPKFLRCGFGLNAGMPGHFFPVTTASGRQHHHFLPNITPILSALCQVVLKDSTFPIHYISDSLMLP